VEEGIKYIFVEAKTLDDRERHPALEMPTSRMAHVNREREREGTYKTISRQRLSN
jgi:hypothetical protein